MKFLKITTLILLLLSTLPSSVLLGQKGQEDEGPVGIFNSRAEYHEFMGSAKSAAYGEGGTPELRAMIPMLNDIALNKPAGWTESEYNTNRSTLGLLGDETIRKELDMMDDQYEKLQQVNEEIQKQVGEQIRGLDFGDRESLVTNIRGIRERAESDLNSVLLPHQLKRLRQIRMQTLLRRRSLVEILTNDPIKSELEITDEQTEELKDAEKEINEKLAKKIAKLQEEARQELISKLDPGQRKDVNEMIGDAFDTSSLEVKEREGKGKRAAKGDGMKSNRGK